MRGRPMRRPTRRPTSRMALVAAFALLLGLTGVLGCGGQAATSGSGVTAAPDSTDSRKPAPAFSGVTMDGAEVSLATFEGKPLALIFWATW